MGAQKLDLKRCYIALRGIILWLVHFKTPFDEFAYMSKNIYVRQYNKNSSRNVEILNENPNCYTKISGNWLKYPRLHFYTFNWIKEKGARNESRKIEKQILKTFDNKIDNKISILIVLHQLSRTGAPILGFDLAKRISKYCNVVIVSLDGGELEDSLVNIGIPYHIIDSEFYSHQLEVVLNLYNIQRAIVNSVCSYTVIETLSRKKIPVLSLIHEFYTQTNHSHAFETVHKFSSTIYYPSKVVVEDALMNNEALKESNVRIVPQGLIAPPVTSNKAVFTTEKKLIDQACFDGSEKQRCIILGAGTVEMRKGVDLFVSTAHAVLKKGIINDFRFIWIGDPISEFYKYNYLNYINDYISRAGISDYIKIINPIKNLNLAYDAADIFFLSSRLDPLPLVSIEAMSHGLPLICFNNATGTADYLSETPITCSTVLPYMDINSAASKIHQLINDPNERTKVGSYQKEFAKRRFDMEAYTECILNDLIIDYKKQSELRKAYL